MDGVEEKTAMTPTEALRRVVEYSGKSTRQLASELDRSDSYIRTSLSQGVRPRLDTFVTIAQACGYEVVVRSKDDMFALDFGDAKPSVEYSSAKGAKA